MTDGTALPAHRVMRSFGVRLFGAARLRDEVYEEVEEDASATGQAGLVVCLSAASLAVGTHQAGFTFAAFVLLREILSWLIWSGVTYLIGDKLLRGTATWGELLRTIGFAQCPGLLYGLRAIPVLDVPVRALVAAWKLAAVIVAIRQALDFGTGKAIVTALLGFIAYVGLAFVQALALGVSIAP
ncbi:MAG: YIP1 family protein [Longimicrobiales bacterium]